jgi:hypothetical protein
LGLLGRALAKRQRREHSAVGTEQKDPAGPLGYQQAAVGDKPDVDRFDQPFGDPIDA